jgi:hypothetical protein
MERGRTGGIFLPTCCTYGTESEIALRQTTFWLRLIFDCLRPNVVSSEHNWGRGRERDIFLPTYCLRANSDCAYVTEPEVGLSQTTFGLRQTTFWLRLIFDCLRANVVSSEHNWGRGRERDIFLPTFCAYGTESEVGLS